jgi:hypothetical protein
MVAGGDQDLHDGVQQAEAVGTALLVVPAIEGQRLIHVDLHLPRDRRQPVWTLRPTPRQQERAIAAAQERLSAQTARYDSLRKDPQAEPAFVATTADEVQRLKAELLRLQEAPAAVQGAGYVTIELTPVGRHLTRDPEMAQAMSALDRRIGEANLRALKGPPAPPALSEGVPSYVGLLGCQGSCHEHDDAIAFWKKTQHAQAFPTLLQVGKELSYNCVGCHVVGFDEPGGSNLWSLAAWQHPEALANPPHGTLAVPDLRNVQCEVCHGPGSLHVSAPSKHPVPIPHPSQERCLTCHTKEHSDTFDFTPYLRDILGPGHGADRRAALGNGPTGHDLRHAALQNHSAIK